MISRALPFAITLMLLLIGCAELSGDGDIKFSKYASFSDASRTDVFEKGWLPRALPRSATSIIETHSVDSSEMWVTFRYSSDDIDQLIKECVAGQHVKFPNAERTKRNVTGWPIELTERGDAKLRNRWRMLECRDMQHAESRYTTHVAVDVENRAAWYWLAK